MNGCNGPCEQGNLPCPCPEACERYKENDKISSVFLALLCTALVCLVASITVLWM